MLLSLFCLLLIFSSAYFLRNTIFSISPSKGNYFGGFLWLEILLFILPGLVLLNIYPTEYFFALFKVKQSSVPGITILIAVSISLFFISLGFVSSIFKSQLKISVGKPFFSPVVIDQARTFTWISSGICLLIILVSIIFLGGKHAFLESISSSVSISLLRYDNQTNSSLKFFSHLFLFFTPFLCILIGSPAFKSRNIERLLLFVFAMYLATFYGSKGPFVNGIIAFFISYLTFNKVRPSKKLVLLGFILITSIAFLLFSAIRLQYSDMNLDMIGRYLINRLFIAQIAGVYEQFNLHLQNPEYIVHAIPFASSFTDVEIFHKDLMLISEDRASGANIGIKNTFFIAEAYAIGSWALLLCAPLIYSLNLVLSFKFMSWIFTKYVFGNKEFSKYVLGLFTFSFISITGGFSELLFFKLPILMILFFGLFIAAYQLAYFFYNVVKSQIQHIQHEL